jgi:hypothetical protein
MVRLRKNNNKMAKNSSLSGDNCTTIRNYYNTLVVVETYYRELMIYCNNRYNILNIHGVIARTHFSMCFGTKLGVTIPPTVRFFRRARIR